MSFGGSKLKRTVGLKFLPEELSKDISDLTTPGGGLILGTRPVVSRGTGRGIFAPLAVIRGCGLFGCGREAYAPRFSNLRR